MICTSGMIAVALWSGLITPSPQEVPGRSAITNVPHAVTTNLSQPTETLRGTATWYDYHQGQAAAGSELKRLIGPGWRGQTVTVTGPEGTVTVILTDSCGCPGRRVIDLDPRDFDIISDRSVGVVKVIVSHRVGGGN